MIPIMQTVVSNPSKGIRGNCLWASIASVTEIPFEKFKGFEYYGNSTWFPPLWNILVANNFTYAGTMTDKEKIKSYNIGVDGYYVVGGGSPRGYVEGHAVIFKDGKMMHDPHPNGEGLTSIDMIYMIERKIIC